MTAETHLLTPEPMTRPAAEEIRFPASWLNPARPGYGTFPAPYAAELGYEQAARGCQQAIEQALAAGYRHVDTAFAYRNQDLVGAAIRARGVARGQVFVTSKLHCNNNSYEEAGARIQEALRAIWGAETGETKPYLDAFLLHYPGFGNPVGAWKGLLKARDKGWVRHAGVSNFEIHHLERLREKTGQYPELNQIEMHPFIYSEQQELIEFCQARGIAVEGYSPLAEGQLLHDADLVSLAEAHDTTVARVALKWCMQHGVRPIVGTRNVAHLSSNAGPFNFTLNPAEMSRLDLLSSKMLTRVSLKWQWNPRTAPFGTAGWRNTLRAGARRARRWFELG